ncbi:hypothetical protein PPERSA_11669 [Pseudocohnilembus persalinus]|uniref:Uncharacterized protein n=1 Tax=Pseudocohnilembus persalinus TaxID=266149 RepID=A0A0V0QA02_PSEPJ|nr:hypothetical protein PPERSA_11669 [Pseudocohnilembus persalinus]|eukprot:KRW99068.1 hypothetical protein PPERSA_11669 [Pseudocohnilembus persalinus]
MSFINLNDKNTSQAQNNSLQYAKVPKQNQDIFSTHKNDLNLPLDEQTHKPQKYQNKDRNLKPVTYDYRKFVTSQHIKQKNDSIFHEDEELTYENNNNTQQSTKDQQEISHAEVLEQRKQHLKSPLYDKLHTETISSQNNLQNSKFTSNSPLNQSKNQFESQFYLSQQQLAYQPKTDQQMLENLKIPSLLNTQNSVQYEQNQFQSQNSKFCDHGIPFQLPNNEDNLLVKEVQTVLQKKEKNHHNIYKMLEDQRLVVGKLLKKYKKRSLQEERLLQQKMRELEKLKNNYITLRSNEEMLINLQIQIGTRMKDYRQNQTKLHDQIMQQKNYFENKYQDKLKSQYQSFNNQQQQQQQQSPLFNKLNTLRSNTQNSTQLPNFYQTNFSKQNQNMSQQQTRLPNNNNTLVQSKFRSFSKNGVQTAVKQNRRGKSSASIHNFTQY